MHNEFIKISGVCPEAVNGISSCGKITPIVPFYKNNNLCMLVR